MPTAHKNPLRALLAILAVIAMTATGLGASPATADEHKVFNASEMELGTYSTETPVGDFIVNATDAKTVAVDEQDRTGGGMTFTQRLKLGGAGSADYRSVEFTTSDEATVDIYALSSSSSADRALALYTESGTEIARAPAYGEPTDIPVATLGVPEAGTYYVASPSSGVNIFYLEVTEGAAPERPAWDDVADPVITEVTVDGSDIDVAYDGVVGFEGADLATATLFDADGDEVTSGISGTPGESGSISLTPSASGDYEVQVALTRNDEEAPKLSEPEAAPSFTLPLASPEIHTALTSAVSDGEATVTVEWTEVPEAETYAVSYRETGAADWIDGPTTAELSADVTGLVPGDSYELQVTAARGEDSATSETYELTVADTVERWLSAHAGVSSGGELTENEDGSLEFDMRGNNGKIADSEDGFLYYYTEIDPDTENFTLSATFTVDDASGKDNQSGFGVTAVDTFVPNDRSARYFNSAGTMTAKYQREVDGGLDVRYGTPGGKFVTGYTEGPTVSTPDRDTTRSQPFDWDYRDGMTEGSNANPPRFQDGDVYEYTLRKSNTGFHAIWNKEGEEEPLEIIDYDPDLLLQQTSDSYYAGVFVTRDIVVTASDIEFTTIHPDDDEAPMERPTTYVTPTLESDVTRTTPHDEIEMPLVSNVHGEAVVLDDSGDEIGRDTLEPGARGEVTVPLEDGENDFTVELTPAPREEQTQLGEYEDLSSYDPFSTPLTITVDRYGQAGEAIHVTPDGAVDGDGTPDRPLDLHTAVAFAQPGQQVVLEAGTYRPTRAIEIDRGNNGTPESPITLMSEPGGRATLDLSESDSGGIKLRGDHWHLYNLELTQSQGYEKPLLIEGNHNVVERIESHHNGDTGVQISLPSGANEPFEMWPSHNLVLSSVAHNNADPLGNDADGFAAKLTVGDGNEFRYCIAHNNIDDGWDLYAKSTEGPIGDVVIEDSVAYNNGWLDEDPDTTGEGNGFKLGGESMPGQHVLRNSVSFDNLAKGITSNSGPDVRVFDVTAYQNGATNLQLTTSAETTDYKASGVLSYDGEQADQIDLRDQEDTIRTDSSNYLTYAGESRNSEGVQVQDDWFVSLDTEISPAIADDGSVEMNGLLELTEDAPADTGARLDPNPEPTSITLLPPVSEDGDEPNKPGPPPHQGVPGPPPHRGEPGPPPHAS